MRNLAILGQIKPNEREFYVTEIATYVLLANISVFL